MTNKIEQNCLALIIASSVDENIGKVVVVGKCLGEMKEFSPSQGKRWEINRSIKTILGNTVSHVGERQLLRIDGEEEMEFVECEEVCGE